MGCLKAMAVRLGCLVLLVLAALLGWLYRERLVDWYQGLRGGSAAGAPRFVSPGPDDLERARLTLRRLAEPGGPAYVDLDAGELAALVDGELAREPSRVVDSVAVALGRDQVELRATLDLAQVPQRALGPLAGMLDRREPVTVAGTLSADTLRGRLDWTITALQVRDFPFPRGTIPALLRALRVPGLEGSAVPIPVAAPVGDVRVSPGRVRLYRGGDAPR